jgi:uncharacterized protein YndB with AHSA1/START domain
MAINRKAVLSAPARNLWPQDGHLDKLSGRYVIRFERRFSQPIERVWQAITTPSMLQQWIGANEVRLELVPGGTMESRVTGPQELVDAIVREAGEAALATRDTVLRVEPPHVFEHTFGGDPASVVRWELHPDGDSCLLLLTHIEPPAFDGENAPRDLAGWHALLELLTRVVDGREVPEWSIESWTAHKERYAQKLGLGV